MAQPESNPKTHIATSTPTNITIRGRDLVNDLIGKHSYTEMLYFLIKDRIPSREETRVLDACLVTLMEHGWTPPSLIARILTNAVPGQIQVAMAAGLLSIGDVNVGTMEGCAALLEEGLAKGGDPDEWCRETVARFRAAREAIPGFGHPFHKPDDPRPARLFEVAKEAGVKGNYIALLQRLSGEIDRAYGKHITINATGAIGALLLEIALPPNVLRGLAVVSRAGGLIGHVVEEQTTKATRNVWREIEQNNPYEDPPSAGD